MPAGVLPERGPRLRRELLHQRLARWLTRPSHVARVYRAVHQRLRYVSADTVRDQWASVGDSLQRGYRGGLHGAASWPQRAHLLPVLDAREQPVGLRVELRERHPGPDEAH